MLESDDDPQGIIETADIELADTGPVHPESCSHVFGYDEHGTLITDTATDPFTGRVYVKTFSWDATGTTLLSESLWVEQAA